MLIVNFFSEFIHKHLLSICQAEVWVIKHWKKLLSTLKEPLCPCSHPGVNQSAGTWAPFEASDSLITDFYLFRLFLIANNFWPLPGPIIHWYYHLPTLPCHLYNLASCNYQVRPHAHSLTDPQLFWPSCILSCSFVKTQNPTWIYISTSCVVFAPCMIDVRVGNKNMIGLISHSWTRTQVRLMYPVVTTQFLSPFILPSLFHIFLLSLQTFNTSPTILSADILAFNFTEKTKAIKRHHWGHLGGSVSWALRLKSWSHSS